MHTTSTAAASGGASPAGIAVLAVLAYLIAAATGFTPGPRDLWRAIRHPTSDIRHPLTRRSDDQDPDAAGVVSDVGSAKVIPIGALSGPRPIGELRAEQPDREDDEPPPVSRRERRDWVAARLRPDDPLGLSMTEIDAQGARLFDCSPKTIERDRFALTGRQARGTRP